LKSLNGGLPVKRITYEYISKESESIVHKIRFERRKKFLSMRKPFLKLIMAFVRYWRQAIQIVIGVGVDRVNLGGNSDTVGMHRLRKIASLTEFMRNSSFLCGCQTPRFCGRNF